MNFRGLGYGKPVYKRLGELVQKQGYQLASSDTIASEFVGKIWTSLEAEGWARKDGEKYIMIDPAEQI